MKIKPIKEPTLFYHTKIEGPKTVPLIVGDFFEEVTKNLLNLNRLSKCPLTELNPDLANEDETLVVEAKACSVSRAIKIRPEQFNYYKDLLAKKGKICSSHEDYYGHEPNVETVQFIFWFYHKVDFGEEIRIEEAQVLLAKNLYKAFLLDIEDVQLLLTKYKNITCKRLEEFIKTRTYNKKRIRHIKVYEFLTKGFNLVEVPVCRHVQL